MNGEAVQRVGCLGDVEEVAVEVNLHHTAGSAFEGGHAETTRVVKRIQQGFALQVFDEPLAQVARIEVETGIAVQGEVDGIPDAVLFDFAIQLGADDKSSALLFLA